MQDIYKDLILLEDEQEEQDKDLILDMLDSLTHIYREDEDESIRVPWYCMLSDVANDFGYSDKEMSDFAQDKGYIVFKISPIGSFEGGLAIADKDVDFDIVKENVRHSVIDDFDEEKDIPEVKITIREDESLKEEVKEKPWYLQQGEDDEPEFIGFAKSHDDMLKKLVKNHDSNNIHENTYIDELDKDTYLAIREQGSLSEDEIDELNKYFGLEENLKESEGKLIKCPDEELERLEKELDEIGFKVVSTHPGWDDTEIHYQIITKEGNQDKESFDEYIDKFEELLDRFEEETGAPCTFNMGLQNDGYISCGFDVRGIYYVPGDDRVPSRSGVKLSFRDGKPADEYTKMQLKDIAKHMNMSDDDILKSFPLDKKNEALEKATLKDVKEGQTFKVLGDVYYCDVNEEGMFVDDEELVQEFVDNGFKLDGSSLIIPSGTTLKFVVSQSVDSYEIVDSEYSFDVGEWSDDALNTPVEILDNLDESLNESEDEVVEETSEYKITKTIAHHFKTINGVARKGKDKEIYQVYFRTQDFNPSVNRWMNKGWTLQPIDFKTLDEVHEYLKKYDKTLKSDLEEDIEKHDELNHKLFEGNDLREDVKSAIRNIAGTFIDELQEDGVALTLKDIILVGSNVSYNYTKDSDLDIHLIVDSKALDMPKELVDKLYSAYRSIFNKNYDIKIKGIPAEIYVELDDMGSAKSNGIYSLNDGWLKEPVQQDIPDLDENAFNELFNEWQDKYAQLINKEDLTSEEVKKFIEDLYMLRKEGIANEGEYALGNLVFKEFRNLGQLDDLKELRKELKGKELSLENLDTTNKDDYNDNDMNEELVNDEEAFWNMRDSIHKIASDKYDEVNLILDNGEIRPITKDELANKFAVSIEQAGNNDYKSREELEKFANETNALKIMFFVYKGQYGGEYSFLYDDEDVAKKIAKEYNQEAYAKYDDKGEYHKALVEQLKESKNMSLEELNELIEKLYEHLKEFNVHYEIWPEDDDTISAEIDWGDWKHDHLWFDHEAIKFLNSLGYSVVNTNVDVIEEDGSDTYSAIHSLQLRKRESESLEENINDVLRPSYDALDKAEPRLRWMCDGTTFEFTDASETDRGYEILSKLHGEDKVSMKGPFKVFVNLEKEESLKEAFDLGKDFEKISCDNGKCTYEYKGTGYFPEVVARLQNKLGKFDYVDEDKRIICLKEDFTELGKQLIRDANEIGLGKFYDPYAGNFAFSKETYEENKDSINKWLDSHQDYGVIRTTDDKEYFLTNWGFGPDYELGSEEEVLIAPKQKEECLKEENSKRDKLVDEFEKRWVDTRVEFAYLDEYDEDDAGLEDYEGEYCDIINMTVDMYDEDETEEDNFNNCYWSIRFDDGEEYSGIPGRALIVFDDKELDF